MSKARIEVTMLDFSVKNVLGRWRKQYREEWRPDITEALEALPENATKQQINTVIGNDSWTTTLCDSCGEWNAIIRIGEEPDYESKTLEFCGGCSRHVINELTRLLRIGDPNA